MKPLVFLLALAGCAPPPPAPDPAQFRTSQLSLVQADYETAKHMRDAERYQNAGMFDPADREFWFAELKALGRLRDQARVFRLALRDRRGAAAVVAYPLVSANLDRDLEPVPWSGAFRCCRIPQQLIEITKHVREAERFAAAGRADDAIREYYRAEAKILGLRDPAKSMEDLLPLVRSARRSQEEGCGSP